MKIHNRLFYGLVLLAILLSCGKGDGPAAVTKNFSNLFSTGVYKDVTGSVATHFDDEEVEVTISGLPELSDSTSSYKVYGVSTSDVTLELGALAASALYVLKNNEEEHHDMDEHMTLHASLHSAGMPAHTLQEVYVALVDHDENQTKILTVTLQGTTSTTEGSTEGSASSGHEHY